MTLGVIIEYNSKVLNRAFEALLFKEISQKWGSDLYLKLIGNLSACFKAKFLAKAQNFTKTWSPVVLFEIKYRKTGWHFCE